MSKPTTHVLVATDRSGSMGHLADDVRGGYNTYVQSLQDDDEGRYRITSVTFSDDYESLCVAAKPKDVPRLDAGNYSPGGMTALLDAIGKVIVDFERETPKLGDDDRVLLVVQTDGQENSSREYTQGVIAQMIKDREATGKWSSVFMGAGVDTWKQGAGMGFGRSVSYANSAKGTSEAYSGLTHTSRSYSRGVDADEALRGSGLTVESDAQ